MPIRRSRFALLLCCLPLASLAQTNGICTSSLMVATPVRPALLSPVASEFSPLTTQLAAGSGVLAQAFDEALSVDNVLLRIRQDGCRAIANARPAGSVVDRMIRPHTSPGPNSTTRWRFNMTQNGKRMTADEFDAWMKTRGVRIAKGTLPVVDPTTTVPSEPPPSSN